MTAASSKQVDQLTKEYDGVVSSMRATFEKGKTKDLNWRRKQLEQVIKMIAENHEEITAAVQKDLGGAKLRGVGECTAAGNANKCLDNLSNWAKEDWVTGYLTRHYVRPEPKGVVLIIAPWNFPFAMCFQPMVPAIAAGNCVVIKPSEMCATCAPLIEKLVKQYMDPECVKVVQGAIPETTALLNVAWDHIFYTGNGAVGKIVMTAAAKHLCPVSLELGGKSPCIVDETANMEAVCQRIGLAKWMNQGQICVAPDYVLVHETRAKEFLEKSKELALSSFGADSKGNADWGTIIAERHVERLQRLIDTSGGEVVCGGSSGIDKAARHVPPTIISQPKPDAPIMNEEIFGPVLAVQTYKELDEATKFINSKETPLALYMYSENDANIEKVLSTCSSGGACVNTSLEQVLSDEIPFGGKGASGMGSYHAKFGFDEFSHRRGVIRKTTLPGFRGPVYPLPSVTNPMPAFIYNIAIKLQVGFVPRSLRPIVKLSSIVAALSFLYTVVLKRLLFGPPKRRALQ